MKQFNLSNNITAYLETREDIVNGTQPDKVFFHKKIEIRKGLFIIDEIEIDAEDIIDIATAITEILFAEKKKQIKNLDK